MAKELEVRVKEVIQRSYNVKSVRLDIGGQIDFKAGQFLSITLQNNPDLKRYLSISSSPTEQCYLEITKKITNSAFSKALEQLKPAETVKIEYPFGKFTLDDPNARIAFLSGGIGITPIRSIVKYAIDKNLGTDMALVYANRSVRDIVFKEDFDSFQKLSSKLKVVHVLCDPTPGFKCIPGLINDQVIKNEISDYMERKFYLCGPPQMVEAMKKMLVVDLRLPQGQVVTENFQGY